MSDTGRARIGLQLGAWLGISAIYFALDLGAQEDARVAELVVRAVVWGVCGWLVSMLAWWGWARAQPEEWSPSGMVFGATLGGLGFGTLWLLVFTAIDALVELEPGFVPLRDWSLDQAAAESMAYAFPMIAWHGVAFSLRQVERRADDRARAAEAEQLAQRAELDALRYQLNPHLLFNALNSAMAMIDEDPQRAEDMLLRLTFLLRSTLRAPREGTVGEELERIAAYLELEGVRFEDRLDVQVDVEPGLDEVPLPTLLLQPLVENAIKHGMQCSSMPLRLRIRVSRKGRVLTAVVANSGRMGNGFGRDAESSTESGVGLANVRARVAAHYGHGGTLRVAQVQREGEPWVEAELCLDGRRARLKTLHDPPPPPPPSPFADGSAPIQEHA
ncbi:MAG: histidine kinase [Myxococcota bacterium]